ncbi:hypothetical protein Plhal304r1_c008g0033921 [Plasmopara halstedii]
MEMEVMLVLLMVPNLKDGKLNMQPFVGFGSYRRRRACRPLSIDTGVQDSGLRLLCGKVTRSLHNQISG